MGKKVLSFCVLIFFLSDFHQVLGQGIPQNLPIFNEYLKREQLKSNLGAELSLVNMPVSLHTLSNFISEEYKSEFLFKEEKGLFFSPLVCKVVHNSKRPYGWGMGMIQPGVGFQLYQNFGIGFNSKWLSFQLAPEFLFNQNRPFDGFPDHFNNRITRERFFYWNNGDFPERFGTGSIVKAWWGQSSLVVNIWKLALGVSTENIWWGPGQFNSLSYSNNAQGFLHAKLQTREPIKTPIGNFEFNMLSGRIDDSGIYPSQSVNRDRGFFREFTGDWKYMNSLIFSYNPKWVKGLHLGFVRTNQQYSQFMDGSLGDVFPVFNPIQKVNFGFNRDEEGRDQQIVLFSRFLVQPAKAEFYFEYGRRDHAFNWREAILNPEHARAYLLGFNKLLELPNSNYDFQIRGEIVHQQESVNRYIRYPGLRGNQTWHTHGRARGFTNLGQPLGVGIGVGSNVQSLEGSFVDGLNKKGIVIERLSNHQDFYFRAFGQQQAIKPWVDLSLGVLWDHQWKSLIMSSKVQFIHANNYQWQLTDSRQEAFSKGSMLFSVFSRFQIIYLI